MLGLVFREAADLYDPIGSEMDDFTHAPFLDRKSNG
jgi:hypothetical protein